MIRALRYTTFFLALVNVAVLIALYAIAYKNDSTSRNIRMTQKNIAQEYHAGLALKAEWSYLNEPQRLARLSKTYLHLSAPQAAQIKTLDTLKKEKENA